jgi:DNA helicase II / ATP-dependent DNA helicase PcrA
MVERFHRQVGRQPPLELAKAVLREVAYRNELARLYPDGDEQATRWAAVEELVNALGEYSRRSAQATLPGFLQEVAVNGNETDDDKQSKLQRDAVALMTLHAAKGLEFREVYMVGMEEGTLPHHRSINAPGAAVDEERRLCYVGVTRAQRRLTLTMALSRMKWGKPRPTLPSRFLYELIGKADNPNYAAAKSGRNPRARPSPGKRPPTRPAATPKRKKS